ncbi:uncharacterized protein LOC131148679 [Malania oleifera]|uniref:uncharacterized protein LOC131148679 n=1 Tax=Malania oleifera TaxID=397392 RepID=UPI0025ADDF8F|nr:uncharacterized protein LOC131148679 [Malania oleifera]XP_057954534.1 uncharacterized protein LOC131148679 [Malania oleifera]XP_057954535.1 uncharacterized protein LOC131148679 [Malania oleifera]XP_057954536.1 uncharacterized protein LOC131148679 [Malania oleifera]
MKLSLFKLDIDELIDEFAKCESTSLAEMKRLWLSRKFSFIYEARPSNNLGFFMQSLYSYSIGHMFATASLSCRLGGLYCLYCLYETQPFKPPFRIYLSLGEMKKLKDLVVDAKENGINVVSALVERMLERNMFLFGFVDTNEGCAAERLNELTDIQNAQVQVAYKKLLANNRIEHFLHLDLGMELDLEGLKKMSTAYAKTKELAIKEASKLGDVQNIKHISENMTLIGDVMEKISEDWNAEKEMFYQQTGFNQQCHDEDQEQQQEDDEDLHELNQLLWEA